MSAKLHLCTADDAEKLMPLIEAFHTEMELPHDPARVTAALAPLLDGSPHGAAYLIGPRVAPVGYIVVCFGYSLELGGIDGFIDEFYIRPRVRGRGMGTEVLQALVPALAAGGVMALHLEVDREDAKAQRLYTRAHFKMRERYALMTRQF
ncbi:GNAT family N-acetyltransferase [Alphaproteobacteria bacterium KMM 3653]|uniref:GNAT family N-acetyltransferase n=1 Tax=Harenicola maris TaxID=2841044 RepID=A0AAP2CP08_9RHOB|nr:GNAT family N-acetyltransferase [Harenicola maris]